MYETVMSKLSALSEEGRENIYKLAPELREIFLSYRLKTDEDFYNAAQVYAFSLWQADNANEPDI